MDLNEMRKATVERLALYYKILMENESPRYGEMAEAEVDGLIRAASRRAALAAIEAAVIRLEHASRLFLDDQCRALLIDRIRALKNNPAIVPWGEP